MEAKYNYLVFFNYVYRFRIVKQGYSVSKIFTIFIILQQEKRITVFKSTALTIPKQISTS